VTFSLPAPLFPLSERVSVYMPISSALLAFFYPCKVGFYTARKVRLMPILSRFTRLHAQESRFPGRGKTKGGKSAALLAYPFRDTTTGM
jgi:hypothetical protein